MTPQTEYILGEVEHLRFCGARWEYICKVLNKTPDALNRMARRNNRPDLAPPIRYKKKEN